jgi:hypothetical protein
MAPGLPVWMGAWRLGRGEQRAAGAVKPKAGSAEPWAVASGRETGRSDAWDGSKC